MGAKYTTQLVSGYNASPPPDDGSTGANNLVKWSNHKTKIGDPLLNLAQGINSALLNALDFSSRTVAVNDTASASDHMRTIEVTAAITETLPTASVVGSGFIVHIKNNGTGVVNINLQTATDTLDSVVNGTFSLQPSQGIIYKTNTAANGYYSMSYYQGSAQAITSRRNTVLIGPTDISGMPSFLPQSVTGLNLTTQNIAAAETTQTATVTFTAATPGVVNWTGHTLVANQAISFTNAGGGLPAALTAGVTYYVLSPVTNAFNVSATPGGSAIAFSTAGTGTQTAWAGIQNPLVITAYSGNDSLYGEINSVGLTTTQLTWTALTNNSTLYLYCTLAAGVLTPAFTALAPVIVYGSVTTPSVVSGQITINVTLGETYLGNGVSAVETPLVVIGTATTSGGNITATQAYSYGKPQTFTGKMSGTLLKRSVYTTAGTFTWIKSAQTTAINVTVKGGGGVGGGGGTSSGGAGSSGGGGGGGGGGGYAKGMFDASLINSETITLASGGTSSFGSLISATAGSAGSAAPPATTATTYSGGLGGNGGTGTGGDIQISGHPGISGSPGSGTSSGNGGAGGSEGAGNGGASSSTIGNAGTAGSNGGGGGGGSGGYSTGAGTVSGGSPGAASVGYVIVEEYA